MVPVWKITDGNILVALPWLSTDSLPVGETEITVGGQTVKIIAYTSIADKKLTLQSVGATSTVGDHTNEITITDASKNEVTYSAFTEVENKVLNYKLAFIGKGVIEVTINCNKVVD